jgi:WD40 repeat protein
MSRAAPTAIEYRPAISFSKTLSPMANLLDYRSVGSASSFFVKINAIEINGDGSLIAVADASRKLRIFGLEDLASGAAASITVDCSAEIHSLAWSGSSSRIFNGLSDGTLAVASITSVSGSNYQHCPPDPSEHRIN